MNWKQYAKEVEFVMDQYEGGTLELGAAWGRIQLLTIALRSEDPDGYFSWRKKVRAARDG